MDAHAAKSAAPRKRRPADLIWSLAAALCVPAAVGAGYLVVTRRLAGVGAKSIEALLATMTRARLPDDRMWDVVAMAGALALIGWAIDLWRGRATGTAVGLALPAFVAATVFTSPTVLAAAMAGAMVIFAARKVMDHTPEEPSGELTAWWWLAAIPIVATPVLMARSTATPWVAVAWPASYAAMWIAGLSWRRWLRLEAGFTAMTVAAAAMLPLLAKETGPMAPAALAVLLVAMHMYWLGRRRSRVRLYNTLMLALFVTAIAVVEVSLTPLHLGERADVPGTRVTRKGPQPKILGRVLPNGEFNNMPEGWYVEVGRIRGPAVMERKPPRTFRIVALGASSTEGHGLDRWMDTWPAKLGVELNKLGKPYHFETINAGIGGYTTLRIYLNLKHEMIRYEPDMVIVYAAHNDALYSFGTFTERELYQLTVGDLPGLAANKDPTAAPAPGGRLARATLAAQRWLSRFNLYRLWRRPVMEARRQGVFAPETGIQVPALPLTDFLANLELMVDFCREKKIRLVFVGEGSLADLGRYKGGMADVAKSRHVPYHDANSWLANCAADIDRLFLDDVHLNPDGTQCVAKAMVRFLDAQHLLPGDVP